MTRLFAILAASCLLILPACQRGQDFRASASSAEDELRRIDLDHSRSAQAADAQAVAALTHPSYTAHLPNGQLADRALLLTIVGNGSLARERHQRVHERVFIAGDTGIVIGIDRLEEPPPLARQGERTRRYTNVYVREDGNWRLLARHFNFLP